MPLGEGQVVEAAQNLRDLGGGAVVMVGQLMPEGDRAAVRVDGLVDVVEGADCGDVVLGEPLGNTDFPARGVLLAGAGDAGDDPAGKPEDRVLAEPDGLGAVDVDARLVAGAAQQLIGFVGSGGGHDATTTVWMRCRKAATSGARPWRWA